MYGTLDTVWAVTHFSCMVTRLLSTRTIQLPLTLQGNMLGGSGISESIGNADALSRSPQAAVSNSEDVISSR